MKIDHQLTITQDLQDLLAERARLLTELRAVHDRIVEQLGQLLDGEPLPSPVAVQPAPEVAALPPKAARGITPRAAELPAASTPEGMRSVPPGTRIAAIVDFAQSRRSPFRAEDLAEFLSLRPLKIRPALYRLVNRGLLELVEPGVFRYSKPASSPRSP